MIGHDHRGALYIFMAPEGSLLRVEVSMCTSTDLVVAVLVLDHLNQPHPEMM